MKKKLGLNKKAFFPNLNYTCKYDFYLPSSLNLKTSEISFIFSKINKILKNS